MNFGNLSPRQKKIMLALLGAGGLALIVMFSRRGAATAATAAPTATDLGATSGIPTFADNGAQAAGLSTDVTGALGDVATELDQLSQGFSGFGDRLTSVEGRLDQAPASPTSDEIAGSFAAAFAPIAQAFTNSGAQNTSVVKAATSATKTITPTTAQAKAIALPNVSLNTNPSSARAGLAFETKVKDGKVYRYFESKAGKGDYGQAKDSIVYIRPATSK